MTGTISTLAEIQAARGKFNVIVNGEKGARINGELASKLSSFEGKDCLVYYCSISNVVFDLKLHMRTSLFSDKFDRFDNTKLSANLYAHLLVETRESVDYEIVLG